MGETWRISVKGMIGSVITTEVSNPQEATVLDIKKQIHQKDSDLPPYLQRLVCQTPGGARTKLEEGHRLTSYPDIKDGSTLFLIRLAPCEVYVHDVQGKLHTVVIPSSEPENYYIAELRVLVEEKTRQRLDEYQFQLKGRPLEETRHGKQLTLRHYGIKAHDTLFLMKIGFTLDITNPQVDVCFMVDCTGSMASWIEAVKNNVKQLRDRLDADYKGCDLRFAFVRYTDYDQPSYSRTTWLDFTNSQPSFHNFVGAIKADGGGDSPEDIMGALKTVFRNLNWRESATRVLIHIADAPCHGKPQYHDLDDTYPGGDPGGISHEEMMREVAHHEVQYWFGYINKSHTDKMIAVFNESLRRLSENRLMIRQFEAIQPNEIGAALHKSVSDSVFAREAAKKAPVRSYTLSSTIPDWNSTLLAEYRAKKTPPPGVLSLQDLQEEQPLELPCVPVSFKRAPNPFAEGLESVVFHAYDTNNRRSMVLKQFRREGSEYNSRDAYMKVLETQTVAAVYAREFNNEKQRPGGVETIEFVPLDVVECSGGVYYALQPIITGKFEKFSNNAGVVCSKSPYSQVLQAFSHYSWQKSGNSLLICDLQGVPNGGRLQLTDPAIHTRSGTGKFGATDLGYAGIQRFFKTHTCNDTCHKMDLKPFSV